MTTRKTLIAKADALCSKYVRSRGFCERCGSSNGRMEWAHILPRHYLKVRWDPRDAWCLCSGCHRYVDGLFAAKNALMLDTIGQEVFDELWETARSTRVKVDLPAVIEQLESLTLSQEKP